MPFITLYQNELQNLIDNSPYIEVDSLSKPIIVRSEDFHDFISPFKNVDTFREKLAEAEETVLKNVLKTILKREPVLEDAPRLTKGYRRGLENGYEIAFDGVHIGTLQMSFPNWLSSNPKVSVEFIPTEKYKLDGNKNH